MLRLGPAVAGAVDRVTSPIALGAARAHEPGCLASFIARRARSASIRQPRAIEAQALDLAHAVSDARPADLEKPSWLRPAAPMVSLKNCLTGDRPAAALSAAASPLWARWPTEGGQRPKGGRGHGQAVVEAHPRPLGCTHIAAGPRVLPHDATRRTGPAGPPEGRDRPQAGPPKAGRLARFLLGLSDREQVSRRQAHAREFPRNFVAVIAKEISPCAI
jgi:hypothetical protein